MAGQCAGYARLRAKRGAIFCQAGWNIQPRGVREHVSGIGRIQVRRSDGLFRSVSAAAL